MNNKKLTNEDIITLLQQLPKDALILIESSDSIENALSVVYDTNDNTILITKLC